MYEFKYRLQSTPEARNDGGGQVSHDIFAIHQEMGNGGWTVVPGHHKDIVVPAADLETVMDMADSIGEQKQAKNAAYKQLLADHRHASATPLTKDWTTASLQQFMDANDASALQAQRANDYITVTLEQEYPVDFAL